LLWLLKVLLQAVLVLAWFFSPHFVIGFFSHVDILGL